MTFAKAKLNSEGHLYRYWHMIKFKMGVDHNLKILDVALVAVEYQMARDKIDMIQKGALAVELCQEIRRDMDHHYMGMVADALDTRDA